FHGGGKREDVQNFVTEKAQDKKTFAEDTDDDLPF
ncbi:MAG: single-stranded DNA-binding protein, partial [Chryseobacterium sp.]